MGRAQQTTSGVANVGVAGDAMLHTRVQPTVSAEWTEAQAINGISPIDVVRAPALPEIWV